MAIKGYLQPSEFGELEEEAQKSYRPIDEEGTGYVLDIEAVEIMDGNDRHYWNLEDVGGLKSALGAERDARQKAESTLKDFGDIKPSAAKSALRKIKEFSELDPEKEAEAIAQKKLKAMEGQLAEQLETERTGFRETILKLTGQLEKELITSRATKAIVDEKGALDLLLPLVKSRTRLKEDDLGEYAVEVLDPKGNPAVTNSGGSISPMSISELVKSMRSSQSLARAFDGHGHTGSDSSSVETEPKVQIVGGKKYVSAEDQMAMGENLEGLASGEVGVTDFGG